MPIRFLSSFHPKRVSHRFTDVLVIGGGIAGLRAALGVAASNQSALVVSKADEIRMSNSFWAQGGIAAVMDPEDRFEDHVSDTLLAGGSDLCDRKVVEHVVREAPRRIRELIDWGTKFDQASGSGLALGREGGHSHRRIVHAMGDTTGKEVMRAIIGRVNEAADNNLDVWTGAFTLDLLTEGDRCRGAVVCHGPGREKTLVWAKQTILATGGCGQIFRETTNPDVATGDGLAIAYRAGVELRDMEFLQFHPTVLYLAGGARSLITEALRGEGAHLVDKSGHRFMVDYDERMELAPRDVVSQSIVAQMEKTKYPNIYLDLTHLDPHRVRSRFPGITALCQKFHLDITRDRLPVRPAAHYMIGGVTVDMQGRTSLDGLWSAGEVTSSGLHGANRLASNSLLEGLVYGAHVGEAASRRAADESPDLFQALPLSCPPREACADPLDVADIHNSLQSLMWRNVGIRRDQERLEEAAQIVDGWCRYILPREFCEPEGWQLQNMLTVSRLMIAAALRRKESRGVHQRIDYPDTDENLCRHLTYQRDNEMGADCKPLWQLLA